MTIYFCNNGVFDLDTIRVMGVSVKQNDNPIGYFGTGLKYAIATLLRTNHKVTLHANGSRYDFEARSRGIRDKEFKVVHMNDEMLAFTTDLGRNWEVWQAYRELYSNCKDEFGSISRNVDNNKSDIVWAISGDGIEAAHDIRHQIFLQTDPIEIVDCIEIHRGESSGLYYRGVKVHDLLNKSRFTYNFVSPMKLTEDRTLASIYDANYKVAKSLAVSNNSEIVSKIMSTKGDTFEASLDFSMCGSFSEVFLDILESQAENMNLKKDLRSVLKEYRQKNTKLDLVKTTEAEESVITQALKILEKLDVFMPRTGFTVVNNLGENILACVHDGKIYITRGVIDRGAEWVASTLYEEYLHQTFNLSDCSRLMQQHLFDVIFRLVREKK